MTSKKAVKLISAEGWEFLVDWDAACVSNTIKNMLSSQGETDAGGRAERIGSRKAREGPLIQFC